MNNLSDLVTTFLASCLTLLLILVLNRVRESHAQGAPRFVLHSSRRAPPIIHITSHLLTLRSTSVLRES